MVKKIFCIIFGLLFIVNTSFSQDKEVVYFSDMMELEMLWDTFYVQFYEKYDFKNVIGTLDKVIAKAEESGHYERWAKGHIYKAFSYFRLEEYDKTIEYLNLLEPYINSLDIEERTYLGIKADFYYVQGRWFQKIGNGERANHNYTKAVDILLGLAGKTTNGEIDYGYLGYDYSFNIVALFNGIALVHYKAGDHDSSIEYYNIALKLIAQPINQTAIDKTQVTVIYKSIGESYLTKGNTEQAKYYFDKVLSYSLDVSNDLDRERLASLYKGLSKYYTSKIDLDSASFFANKGLELESSADTEIRLLRVKGEIYKYAKESEKYENGVEDAIELTQEHFGYFHPEMARNYKLLGEISFEKKDYSQSDQFLNTAMNILLSKKSDDLDLKSLNIDDLLDKRLSLEIAVEKAKTLAKMEKYEEAIDCYQFIHQNIFELQQKVILNDNSKFYLIEQSKEIYEKAIEVSLEIGDKEGAYQFSQLSRSMLLLQQIQEKAAIQISSLPDELIAELQELKLRIDETQKNKLQAAIDGKTTLLETIKTEIFDLNLQYRKLMTKIEEDYPAYYDLKYNIPIKPISYIQNNISKMNSTLVEYFLGENHLYIFVLDGENVSVRKELISEKIFSDIQLMSKSINQYNGSFDAYQQFNNASFSLYELLFEKIEKESLLKTKQLIIIPDEQLNLIPFEALVKIKHEFDDTLIHYHQFEYLIRDYDISYHYSSNLIQSKNKNNKGKGFLGIAPSFKNTDLKELPNNKNEIENINQIYDGTELTGKAATYNNFIENVKNKGVLHFATHAIFNDEIPLDSRIELADTSLYIYEIFAIEHDLQLAVMSACQTASGKRRKGEGVVSLARAFFQSGCSSIVASLWDVSDQKAKGIMNDFHLMIEEGKRKNVALASAKRTYLENAISRNTHPFYWAGFIQIGNISELHNGGNQKQWGLWIVGLALIFISLFIYSKKTYKK